MNTFRMPIFIVPTGSTEKNKRQHITPHAFEMQCRPEDSRMSEVSWTLILNLKSQNWLWVSTIVSYSKTWRKTYHTWIVTNSRGSLQRNSKYIQMIQDETDGSSDSIKQNAFPARFRLSLLFTRYYYALYFQSYHLSRIDFGGPFAEARFLF